MSDETSYVIYPTNQKRGCNEETFQDTSLPKHPGDGVTLTAEHVDQTICFLGQFNTGREPYQAVAIIAFESGDQLETVVDHPFSQSPNYNLRLATIRPGIWSKPAVWVQAWHYLLSDHQLDCSRAADFASASKVVAQNNNSGFTMIESLPYGQWLCLRAEDLAGAYSYKQIQVLKPKFEVIIDDNHLLLAANRQLPESIYYLVADSQMICDESLVSAQANQVDVRSLTDSHPVEARLLIKPLTPADNGKWVCFWGKQTPYGEPSYSLFTQIQIVSVTDYKDTLAPTATIKQLRADNGNDWYPSLELRANEFVSSSLSEPLADEPDCSSHNFQVDPDSPAHSYFFKQTTVDLGGFGSTIRSGYWLCYRLVDVSGNLGFGKFRHRLPSLDSNDAIEQNGHIITIRGAGSWQYIKFDNEPECHNALDWQSAPEASANQAGISHTIELETQDQAGWLCLRRTYTKGGNCQGICPAVLPTVEVYFHKYQLASSW